MKPLRLKLVSICWWCCILDGGRVYVLFGVAECSLIITT
jgi:hypothetical protein